MRRCPPQVWTSFKTLNGREFCFMLNSLIRDDARLTDEVADQVGAGGRWLTAVLKAYPRDAPWGAEGVL